MIEIKLKLKEDAMHICLDNHGKNIDAYVKYPFITCLNQYRDFSFYFKFKKFGYCMIFDKSNKINGQRCYKNLLMLMDKNVKTQKVFQIGR